MGDLSQPHTPVTADASLDESIITCEWQRRAFESLAACEELAQMNDSLMQFCQLSDDKVRQLKTSLAQYDATRNNTLDTAAVIAIRTKLDDLTTASNKRVNECLVFQVQLEAFDRRNVELYNEVSTLTACLIAKDGEIERLSAAIVEKDAAAVRMGTQLAHLAMRARVNEEIQHKLIAIEIREAIARVLGITPTLDEVNKRMQAKIPNLIVDIAKKECTIVALVTRINENKERDAALQKRCAQYKIENEKLVEEVERLNNELQVRMVREESEVEYGRRGSSSL